LLPLFPQPACWGRVARTVEIPASKLAGRKAAASYRTLKLRTACREGGFSPQAGQPRSYFAVALILDDPHGRSLQPGILDFGLFQDGNIGVGVFPEGEKVLAGGAGFGEGVRLGLGRRGPIPRGPACVAPVVRHGRDGHTTCARFEGVATVSAVLTVGSSGAGRVTTILPWTRGPGRRARFRLTTCDCRWGSTHEKSPRTEKRCPWLPARPSVLPCITIVCKS